MTVEELIKHAECLKYDCDHNFDFITPGHKAAARALSEYVLSTCIAQEYRCNICGGLVRFNNKQENRE